MGQITLSLVVLLVLVLQRASLVFNLHLLQLPRKFESDIIGGFHVFTFCKAENFNRFPYW